MKRSRRSVSRENEDKEHVEKAQKLTMLLFKSDLSFPGKGVLAARRIQLTKMVNRIKYSKGLSSVKEYNANVKSSHSVKGEKNKRS